MLIFLCCCISKIQERRRINRYLKSALVVCSSLGTKVFRSAVCAPSVSVQGTLAAAASFLPGPLLLCERWRNVKQRPGRAPTNQGLRGCCDCSSFWGALPPLEINYTLGSTWGLADKTNSQTNSQAGLVHTEEWLQNTAGSKLAAHMVTQCQCPVQMDLMFSSFPCFPRHSATLPCPNHNRIPSTSVLKCLPAQPPWVTWMCGAALLSSGDIPMGFWLAVRLQEGYFLPGVTESTSLGMMWQCRRCREGITKSQSYSQCCCERKGTWSWYSA